MITTAAPLAASEKSVAQAICAALSFEPVYHTEFAKEGNMGGCISSCDEVEEAKKKNVLVYTIATGTLPEEEEHKRAHEDYDDQTEIFYDSMEHHDDLNDHETSVDKASPLDHTCNGSHTVSSVDVAIQIRGGDKTHSHPLHSERFESSVEQPPPPPRAPPPPKELPLRFLRAGKGDPVVGQQRYESTLAWRKEHRMDTILTESQPKFALIKKHYPHFFHLRGKKNEPVYIECPPKTNLKALREGGVNLESLLRHYAFVTEFMWQYVESEDLARSIYIIDLDGIRVTDFVGECVDFVRRASAFCNQHYPERAGCIMVINVPHWFKIIWNVVKNFADEVTLQKIHILRGKSEIYNALCDKIPIENIPPEYGGKSMPLGESPEEELLWSLTKHNNDMEELGIEACGGAKAGCKYCKFVPYRSY